MPDDQTGPKTLRLVYTYEGDEIKLVSKQSVEMIPPDHLQEPKREAATAAGFRYEVRDAKERPLFARDMENPLRRDIEVFSDDPKRSIHRAEKPEKKGVFVLLVPDTPEAQSMVFLESRPTKEIVREPETKEMAVKEMKTKEIARFSLR